MVIHMRLRLRCYCRVGWETFQLRNLEIVSDLLHAADITLRIFITVLFLVLYTSHMILLLFVLF